ncbi:UNVERIFIED_CONTAM: hypothetical protein K2H54_024908 [Gekko kuhli]
MARPANISSDEEEMEEGGPNPQVLQEDPPDKVETPSGADRESLAAVSMPCSQSCSPGQRNSKGAGERYGPMPNEQ